MVLDEVPNLCWCVAQSETQVRNVGVGRGVSVFNHVVGSPLPPSSLKEIAEEKKEREGRKEEEKREKEEEKEEETDEEGDESEGKEEVKTKSVFSGADIDVDVDLENVKDGVGVVDIKDIFQETGLKVKEIQNGAEKDVTPKTEIAKTDVKDLGNEKVEQTTKDVNEKENGVENGDGIGSSGGESSITNSSTPLLDDFIDIDEIDIDDEDEA
eukprot:CAMPEP_0201495366 /NCGR_PEP_ID=MMETSP0151_2-20130828/53558_1 /ASSEMBLY_ACC=CAM_ASM_000257 /TAXON_ID=200890 /ORGANISM="Paramoeba atlantica, Strain 621/1 / CCAP 1560/9" /LENGTH=211 /DNA_ID=CAMNT_0047884317 /DNA_START=23 /DNA_END=654 /DNA_ORIENTATION=-